MKGAGLTMAAAVLLGGAGSVRAQTVEGVVPSANPFFDRNRSVAVADRQVPGYERRGLDLGQVTVQPSLQVGLYAVDNLYATERDRVGAVAAQFTPAAVTALDLGHTYATLTTDATVSRFSRSTENNTTFDLLGAGRHDFGSNLVVRLNGGFRRAAEQRSNPGAINTSVRPILYDTASAGGSATWAPNRILLRGSADYASVRYQDGRLADGALLPQDYRNRDTLRLTGRAEYAVTPDLSLVGQATRLRSDYARTDLFGALDRSSTRIELLGGASFEFTDLLRGEVTLGYVNLRYDSPAFRAFSGFGARAKVEYMPTLLTTVTVRAQRTIEEAGIPQSPFYLRTSATVGVDHELYRNIILSGYVGYETNRFRQPDRHDRRPSVGVSGQYRLNRAVTLVARYDHLGVTSVPRDLGRNLTLNSLSLAVNAGL